MTSTRRNYHGKGTRLIDRNDGSARLLITGRTDGNNIVTSSFEMERREMLTLLVKLGEYWEHEKARMRDECERNIRAVEMAAGINNKLTIPANQSQ